MWYFIILVVIVIILCCSYECGGYPILGLLLILWDFAFSTRWILYLITWMWERGQRKCVNFSGSYISGLKTVKWWEFYLTSIIVLCIYAYTMFVYLNIYCLKIRKPFFNKYMFNTNKCFLVANWPSCKSKSPFYGTKVQSVYFFFHCIYLWLYCILQKKSF